MRKLSDRIDAWALRVLLLAFCVLVGPSIDAQDAEPLTPDQQRIEQLIDNLASVHDRVREAAVEELDEFGSAALGQLDLAANDPARPQRAAAARRYLDKLELHGFKFLDAEGKPIADAEVVFSYPENNAQVRAITNALGNARYRHPPANGRMHTVVARLEHPDYGIASIHIYLNQAKQEPQRLHLLHKESELVGRAARGIIVDEEGNPVPNVAIDCSAVRTPGEGLISGNSRQVKVYTDENGAFRLYLVATDQRQRGNERGEHIPAGSEAVCRLTPPEGSGLWKWAGRVSNAEPTTLVLEKPTLERRVQIETVGGGVLDEIPSDNSTRLSYSVQGKPYRVTLDPAMLLEERAMLMPGRYQLESGGIEYPPVEIDENAPDTVVFKLPPKLTFAGKIVDGRTGEPIARAVIVGFTGRINKDDNLALLTDAHWNALHALQPGTYDQHPALAPIREGYTIQQAAITDDQGAFALSQPIDDKFWGVMAFDEYKVPIRRTQLDKLEVGDNNQVDLGTLKLFPAAKVVVFPQHDEQNRVSVGHHWQYAVENQPEWIGALKRCDNRRTRFFGKPSWLKLNEEQPILVPAEVGITLHFTTPYDDRWGMFHYNETLRLEEGQTITLDEAVTFAPGLPCEVRVVNTAGEPVEGVPVRRYYHFNRTGSVAHNTDAEGVARFYVDPELAGHFYVSMKDSPKAEFDLSDEQAERVYELQLTDEQLDQAMNRQ